MFLLIITLFLGVKDQAQTPTTRSTRSREAVFSAITLSWLTSSTRTQWGLWQSSTRQTVLWSPSTWSPAWPPLGGLQTRTIRSALASALSRPDRILQCGQWPGQYWSLLGDELSLKQNFMWWVGDMQTTAEIDIHIPFITRSDRTAHLFVTLWNIFWSWIETLSSMIDM